MVDEATKYKTMLGKGLSIRAMARILKRAPSTVAYQIKKLKLTGSLQHGNKGKSNRPCRPDKDKIIELATTVYKDFGIAHTCELLAERHDIFVPKETLRIWLKRPYRYHRKKKRDRRECRPNFGDLLQIDGSFDYWFGEEKTCLMHIVDDATNTAAMHFEKQETIVSACRCAWRWFQKYGVPHAFYADGRNMYHLNPDTEHNFFTTMCEVLGIRVVLAHSPQAKGRVERYNGVQQRRLIPLLKLDGIRDMVNANKYLEQYVQKHNKRFAHPPREGNSHTPLPDWVKSIDDICFVQVKRALRPDWTLVYNNKIYQIPPASHYPPAVKSCYVIENISGQITVSYRDRFFTNLSPL